VEDRTPTTRFGKVRGDAALFMRVLLLLRIGVFTLALGGTGILLLSGQGPDAWFGVSALLLAAYIVSALYWFAFREGYRSRFQVYGPIFIDIVVNTWIVHYSGGIESPFALLYILTILSVGAVFQTRPALVAATVSAACFGGLGWLEFSGVLKPAVALALNVDVSRDVAYAFFYVVLQMGFFYTTAVGAGSLSGRLKAKGEALRSTTAELREMRHDTESILENMPSGLVSVNAAGTVVSLNGAAGDMLDLDREAAIGQSLQAVFDNGRRNFRNVLMNVLRGEAPPSRLEITVERPDGREVPMGISVSVLRDSNGATRGVIGVFQDLTEAQRMQRQIRRADRLAAVGELSAAIAHELRNPLASIGGSIELLQGECELSDENGRLMNLIFKESRRLKRITSEFLDFASVRETRIQRVNLGEILREVACVLRGYEWFGEGVTFDVTHAEEAEWVDVDEEQLKQVLLNLGYNALDAMAGCGRLVVEGRAGCAVRGVSCDWKAGGLQDDRKDLVLKVTDSGCGIPRRDRDKVFEPFYSSKPKGVGLGLSIVSRIVEDHGGRIQIESEVGQGTCVTIVLPGGVPAVSSGPEETETVGIM